MVHTKGGRVLALPLFLWDTEKVPILCAENKEKVPFFIA